MENSLSKFIDCNLIFKGASQNGINQNLSEYGKTVYLGTGLCSPRSVSIGIPFDALAMILLANKLKRFCGLKQIIHHIADTHALSNEWINKNELFVVRDSVTKTYQTIIQKLGLTEYSIINASSFDNSKEYKELYSSISKKIPDCHEYIQREVTDIVWYKTYYDMGYKLGWIVSQSSANARFDERMFDQQYIDVFSHDICFVYAKSGRTFDPNRPNVAPYISEQGEPRLLLRKDIKPSQIIKDNTLSKGVKKHIDDILNLVYEETSIVLKSETTISKLDELYELIFDTSS